MSPVFTLLSEADRHRARTEAMIRAVYAETYGAAISSFPRRLAVLLDGNEQPLCAAGLREAEDGFFSEAYLDGPIEQVLADRIGGALPRSEGFEVTTLAGAQPGAACLLLRHIVDAGRSTGKSWAFFTATRSLRLLMRRGGLDLLALAPARRERIANPDAWGRYYDTDPWVCAAVEPKTAPVRLRQVAMLGGLAARRLGGMPKREVVHV